MKVKEGAIAVNDLKGYGEFIRYHRKQSGFVSQRQLSEVSGISSATISRIESEIQRPQIETLKKLSEFLVTTDFSDLLMKAGYEDQFVDLILGDNYKTTTLPFLTQAYMNMLIKPSSKVKFFDYLQDDIRRIKENIKLHFDVIFPEEEYDSIVFKKIIMPRTNYDDIKKQANLVDYINNEFGRMVYKVKELLEIIDKKNYDVEDAFLHPKLSYNNHLLTDADRNQLKAMLKVLFPHYASDQA